MQEIKESRTKIKHRKHIVQIAKKLFIEQGIGQTTMMEIADKVGMGRKTIYNYFENKDILANYIFNQIIEKMFVSVFTDLTFEQTMSHYDKLKVIFYAAVNHLFKYEKEVIYIVHYDYYFKEKENSLDFIEFAEKSKYANILEEIINNDDQSIDFKGTNPEMLISTLSQALMGFASRMFFRDKVIHRESRVSKQEVYLILDILLDGIKK